MSLKLKSFIITSAFIFSLFAYKVDITEANSYDVATATGPVQFRLTLTEANNDIALPVAHTLNHKGKDVYVAIIDTGIEKAHPFFQDRVALEACFATRCPNGTNQMIGSGAAVPVHWHGTHVAGIAAGYNSNFTGVAPEAKIIAINVFNSSGAAYDADIIKALNWINSISNDYNISSVNMSLGGSMTFTGTCDNYIPQMTTAIKQLKDNNIATVISSGNNYSFGMSAPACISHSVSVAATYKNSTRVTDFSNISTHTDLAAPGSSIVSAKLMGSYSSASGTSMSSPFVTGAFAVYRSANGVVSVDKVLSDFQTNGVSVKDSYTNISVKKINFTTMFTSTPSPTTTTTTTLPVTTTTTQPVVTTTTTTPPPPPVVTTTTTVPVVTTTTTLPPPTRLPYIPNPLLLEVNGLPRSFVWIKYRDPYMNKGFLSHYELTCNGSSVYNIPVNQMYSLHSYKLDVPASAISYCSLAGVTIYGTKTNSTPIKNIYPKNKTSSSVSSISSTKINKSTKKTKSIKVKKKKKKIIKNKKKTK